MLSVKVHNEVAKGPSLHNNINSNEHFFLRFAIPVVWLIVGRVITVNNTTRKF